MSTNHKLDYLKRKGSNHVEENLEQQEQRAHEKWERLTWFMLNIDNIQNRNMPDSDLPLVSRSLIDVLKDSGFIEDNPEA